MRVLALASWICCACAMVGCGTQSDQAAKINASESRLIADGHLRTTRLPEDGPFSNADLVRNFGLVAFGVEPGFVQPGRTYTMLTRWRRPIRWRVIEIGRVSQKICQAAAVTMGRLAATAGLYIQGADSALDINVAIFVIRPEHRAEVASILRSFDLDASADLVADTDNIFQSPCNAVYFMNEDAEHPGFGEIDRDMVLLKAGPSDSLIARCMEEEPTQILGLPNDYDDVRPMVFNDDQEFARLTEHDEYLPKILYDPRLKAGMTRDEALDVIPQIVEDLRPDG